MLYMRVEYVVLFRLEVQQQRLSSGLEVRETLWGKLMPDKHEVHPAGAALLVRASREREHAKAVRASTDVVSCLQHRESNLTSTTTDNLTSHTTKMAAPPPPPQWVLDLNSTSPSKPRNGTFPDPPGFTSTTALQKNTKGGKAVTPRAQPSPEVMETLKLKKAWEVAIAPAKQLPMNAIGMYMSGNSLQMFSIMMVFMLFKAPFQALMNINQTFARFETDSKKQEMLMVKAAFVGCNLLALALGTWKVNQMGLLP
jgi:hypothetical protein